MHLARVIHALLQEGHQSRSGRSGIYQINNFKSTAKLVKGHGDHESWHGASNNINGLFKRFLGLLGLLYHTTVHRKGIYISRCNIMAAHAVDYY